MSILRPRVSTRGHTFKMANGRLALERCPECGKENYVLNVLSGICTWCGFDANAVLEKGGNDEKHSDTAKNPGKDSKPQQSS